MAETTTDEDLTGGIGAEPTFADAILDRLIHNAHRLPLDGPSLRKTLDAPAAKPIDGDATT